MRKILTAITLILILVSGILSFTIGQVTPLHRNIIYVHVPPAIVAMLVFTLVFICSIGYLITKRPLLDYIAHAAVEIGLVLTIILNATGMIFAKIDWAVWWTPSPRLVSAAALFFLYAVYLLLRSSFDNTSKRRQIAAVYAILAYINVPFVFISARLLRDIHRPSYSFETSWQSLAFFLSILATLALSALLIWIRADIAATSDKLLENRS